MRMRQRFVRRLAAGAALTLTAGLALPVMAQGTASAAPAAPAATPAPSGGSYVPINPVRVADTRSNGNTTPSVGMTLAAGGTITINPSAAVPAGSTAVALNLVAVDATQPGFLTVYPSGGTRPLESTENFTAGPVGCTAIDCVVSNLVVTPLSTDGKFVVYNGSAGTVDVVADVEGYFNAATNTSGGAGHYIATSPSRIADTRCGESPPAFGASCPTQVIPSANANLKTVPPQSVISVQVSGQGTVPASGAEAAVVQVTATNPTSNGFLTAFPSGATPQVTSTVNFVATQNSATRAVVKLGTNGAISVFNSSGNTDVVVDVVGYFTDANSAANSGGLYTPVAPSRPLDTRTVNGGAGPLAPGESRALQVTGTSSVPSGATAALLNVTEATATARSFLTVTPSQIALPARTSDLNFQQGEIRANADVATLSSSGAISIYNYVGSTDVVVDVFGYFVQAANVPTGGQITGVTPTTGPPGTVVTGTVGNPGSVTSVTVSGCGFNNTPVTFDKTTGAFSITLPAGTPAGACTLTFTSTLTDGSTVTTTVPFTVTGGTPSKSTIAFNPPSAVLQANGTSTQVFTLTVSANAVPLTSDAVTLASSPTTPGACGTLSPTSGTTDANGNLKVTYTTSTTAGFCTITATEATDMGTGTATVTQTTGAPPATKDTVSVTASPSTIAADGKSTSTVTATVTNGATPVNGDNVLFTVASGSSSACGTVSPTVATTNNSGVATTTYTSSTNTGTCDISALEGNTGAANAPPGAVITQGAVINATNVSFSPPQATLQANGTSQQTFTVTVTRNSVPVNGDSVAFTATPTAQGSGAGACGTLSPTTATTQASGTATLIYTSSSTPGFCTITASESGGASGTAQVTQTNGPPPGSKDMVTVAATPSSLAADGRSTSTITATVLDPTGTSLIAGDQVAFTLTPSSPGSCGTISPAVATTGTSGQATTTYTSSTAPGQCSITATELQTGATSATPAVVTQTLLRRTVAVTANPQTLFLNPLTPPSAIQATVSSSIGPVQGDTVVFSFSGSGLLSGCGTISPTSGVSDTSGHVNATYTPPLLSLVGSCTITATDTTDPTQPAGSTTITELLNVT